MSDVRERQTVQKSIVFTETLAEEITAMAKMLDTSFSEIVKVCVQRELPKLKERSRKRKK